ncbi:hypothetical protein VitviT2T_023686 [Vitis vinifera]|uniref:Uncharacterized protein n=2 Tax=Vitis vinifera TaxID=29760 RepID=F6I2V4_VITVI|nr:vegetative cell wall protein gp1 [Vitis vinifera]RVW95420.1 hypothetical protein CK203_028722 [Vitis vinifera]WKA05738.1 hypothetical protein VitviT2T_023686 [Vitis vinifera]|eukprot:XP_010661686.1 PREDICTED: vegetative cell wall protein gp1 [Vitis vinifera]
MANQPAPARPWIRLGSMRPAAPTPAPAAASAAPEAQPQAQPQPPAARPIIRPSFGQVFRPTTQPQQPPFRVGNVSVPTSPIQKTTTSVPTSPVVAKPYGTSSVPTSPVQKVVTTSAFPATTLSSVPTSPVPKSPKTSASSSSVPTSPTTKVISTIPTITTSTTTVITESITVPAPAPEPPQAQAPSPGRAWARALAPAPLLSRLPAQTTPPSEKVKPHAPPPSPLTLPPAQPKPAPEPIEQKTVVIEKPKSPFRPSIGGLQSNVGDSVKPSIVPGYEKSEPGTKDQKVNLKKADSEDASLKIITLAGDNTGAVMELSPARKKPDPEGNSNPLVKKTDLKTWLGTKLGSDASSSDEEKSKKKDKAHNKMGTPLPPMNAFTNSNVQAVNNSILFNTSCNHHDPGVHVFFTRRGGGRGLHIKDHGDGQDK